MKPKSTHQRTLIAPTLSPGLAHASQPKVANLSSDSRNPEAPDQAMRGDCTYSRQMLVLVLLVLLAFSTATRADDFRFILCGDTQFPWPTCNVEDDSNGVCDCYQSVCDYIGPIPTKKQDSKRHAALTEKASINLNRIYVTSMNGQASRDSSIKGVIINGDLTSYGDQGDDLSHFKEYYEEKLNLRLYPGLGNHDTSNPFRKESELLDRDADGSWNNNAIVGVLDYFANFIYTHPKNGFYDFDWNPDWYDSGRGSLAYAWTMGDFYFVQLPNYPGYSRDVAHYRNVNLLPSRFSIESCLSWLRSRLRDPNNVAKRVVINTHDFFIPDYGPKPTDSHKAAVDAEITERKKAFARAIKYANVEAIFCGHLHEKVGNQDTYRFTSFNGNHGGFYEIPVIYCGSPMYGKYLVATFRKDLPIEVQIKDVTTSTSKGGGSWNVVTRDEGALFKGLAPLPRPTPPECRNLDYADMGDAVVPYVKMSVYSRAIGGVLKAGSYTLLVDGWGANHSTDEGSDFRFIHPDALVEASDGSSFRGIETTNGCKMDTIVHFVLTAPQTVKIHVSTRNRIHSMTLDEARQGAHYGDSPAYRINNDPNRVIEWNGNNGAVGRFHYNLSKDGGDESPVVIEENWAQEVRVLPAQCIGDDGGVEAVRPDAFVTRFLVPWENFPLLKPGRDLFAGAYPEDFISFNGYPPNLRNVRAGARAEPGSTGRICAGINGALGIDGVRHPEFTPLVEHRIENAADPGLFNGGDFYSHTAGASDLGYTNNYTASLFFFLNNKTTNAISVLIKWTSDDAGTLFLNGRYLDCHLLGGEYGPRNFIKNGPIFARLNPGPNLVQLSYVQGHGPSGARIAVLDQSGANVPDPSQVAISLSPENAKWPLIQAEDFVQGGEGVGYHDVDSQNWGQAYRLTEGVDIEDCVDEGGGFNVGYTRQGEWLNYAVDLPRNDLYSLEIRLASATVGGTIHVEFDGTDLTGPLSFGGTGGWQNWVTLKKDNIRLPAGPSTMRVVWDSDGGGNLNYFKLSPTAGAYLTSPQILRDRIEAEDFDTGPENVSYHDVDGINNGGAYRSTAVDIESCLDNGGGFNIGWTARGEWCNYTVFVPDDGLYALEVRAASGSGGGTVHFEFDGIDKTGPISFGSTGGWQKWLTVRKESIKLSAGTQVMKVVWDSDGGGNLNYFQFTSMTSPSSPPRIDANNLRVSDRIGIDVFALEGTTLRLESSADLVTWRPVATMTVLSGSDRASFTDKPTKLRFYRAVVVE